MVTKKCFKCGEFKFINDFYKHKGMSDGYLNKCKTCSKKDTMSNYLEKSKNSEWLEKERDRGREKYKRLNYKERQKVLNRSKPWKLSSVYKNLRRQFKFQKEFELHHWNYNKDFLRDVFVVTKSEHRKLHTFLILDEELLVFRDKQGNLLDTKEKHILFLKEKNIIHE